MKKNILNSYVKTHKLYVVALFIVMVIAGFLSPLKSFLMKWLVDSKSMGEVLMYLGFGSAIIAGNFLFSYLGDVIFSKIQSESLKDIRNALMKIFLKDNQSDKGTGECISVLTNDVEILSNDYYRTFYDILFYTIMLVISLLMFVYIDVTMLFFVVIAGFSSVVIPRLLDKKLGKLKSDYSDALSSYTGYSKELLAGKGIISYFLVFSNFFNNYKKQTNTTCTHDFKLKRLYSLSSGLASFVSNVLFFIILMLGIILVLKGRITLGYMVAASNLSNFVIIPCQVISSRYAKLKSCKPIKDKINAIIFSCEDFTEKTALASEINDIQLNNLTFSYSAGKNILKNANFLWENGRIVITGESGAGKSTIAKILHRQVLGYSGSAKINDTEITDISNSFVWENIGYIQQTPFIFNDTIRNNVTLYDNYTDAEVYAVLVEVGLADFVRELSDGLNSVIEESGQSISGGQAQRISVARVLIRKYKWIIADEITSNLDEESKKQVMEALFKRKANLLLITHDIHSDFIERFDKIYKLTDGKLFEISKNQN